MYSMPGKIPFVKKFVVDVTMSPELEIKLDVSILESLASHEVSLKGTKLTKFDKALQQNRNRLDKIYRQL